MPLEFLMVSFEKRTMPRATPLKFVKIPHLYEMLASDMDSVDEKQALPFWGGWKACNGASIGRIMPLLSPQMRTGKGGRMAQHASMRILFDQTGQASLISGLLVKTKVFTAGRSH